MAETKEKVVDAGIGIGTFLLIGAASVAFALAVIGGTFIQLWTAILP